MKGVPVLQYWLQRFILYQKGAGSSQDPLRNKKREEMSVQSFCAYSYRYPGGAKGGGGASCDCPLLFIRGDTASPCPIRTRTAVHTKVKKPRGPSRSGRACDEG